MGFEGSKGLESEQLEKEDVCMLVPEEFYRLRYLHVTGPVTFRNLQNSASRFDLPSTASILLPAFNLHSF